MKNIKNDILAALRGDPELIALLDGTTADFSRVYAITSPYALEFPRLIYTQYANTPAGYGDDKRTDTEVFIILDLYTSGAPGSPILDRADEVMTQAGFLRIDGPEDLYEDLDNLKVYHSVLKYINFQSEV